MTSRKSVMSAAWFILILLLQLVAQPVAPASSSTLNAAQQQELLVTTSPTHGRDLTALRGRSFGGFSRPRTSSYRPVGGAFSGLRLPGTTRLPGGFTGYRRSGFRSTPFILPLVLGSGLLAGAAISSLNNNPNAYCNGNSVQCYLAACEEALRNRCPDAAAESNNTLVLTACPDPQYSECYATPTFNDTEFTSFECFGVRRPSFRGRDDLAAVCHQPGFDSSAGAAKLNKVRCSNSCCWWR
jgi:hypothetical protein